MCERVLRPGSELPGVGRRLWLDGETTAYLLGGTARRGAPARMPPPVRCRNPPFALQLLLGAIMVASPGAILAFAQGGSVAVNPAATGVALPVLTRAADGTRIVRATRIEQPIGSTDGSTRALTPGPADHRVHPAGAAGGRAGLGATGLGAVRRRQPLCRVPVPDGHPEQIVANDMRRDSTNLRQNDNFGVFLDTFHDLRNGYLFYVSPIGGDVRRRHRQRADQQRRLEHDLGWRASRIRRRAGTPRS